MSLLPASIISFIEAEALRSLITFLVLCMTNISTGAIVAKIPRTLLVITCMLSSVSLILFRRTPIKSLMCPLSIYLPTALFKIFPKIERTLHWSWKDPLSTEIIMVKISGRPKSMASSVRRYTSASIISCRFVRTISTVRNKGMFGVWSGLYVSFSYSCCNKSSYKASNTLCSASSTSFQRLLMCLFLYKAVPNNFGAPPLSRRRSRS